MPIECISRASNSCSEIQARMLPAAGTTGMEVPRMNAIFDGDGSPLIVTFELLGSHRVSSYANEYKGLATWQENRPS